MAPEVARHHQLTKSLRIGFESRRPRQFSLHSNWRVPDTQAVSGWYRFTNRRKRRLSLSVGDILRDRHRLQRSQERDDVLFLLRNELQSEHQVEEFHRVVQREQPIVVQVRRRVLDAAQREGFDRTVS